MDLGLDGRVAVVTAASKGLGRATAEALAAEGVRLVLNARAQGPLDVLGSTLPDAITLAGDIADPAMPARLVEAAVAPRGRVPDLALSNLARTALWAWTKTAAQDLAEQGITVNLAAPGLHATDRLLERGVSGRTGDPADFGQVVAFLCSQQAGFINGTVVGVDGGSVNGLL